MIRRLSVRGHGTWSFAHCDCEEHGTLRVRPRGYPVLPLRYAVQRNGRRLAVDLLGRIWTGTPPGLMGSCSLAWGLSFAEKHLREEIQHITRELGAGTALRMILKERGLDPREAPKQMGSSVVFFPIEYSGRQFLEVPTPQSQDWGEWLEIMYEFHPMIRGQVNAVMSAIRDES